jgi:hypothetical protein
MERHSDTVDGLLGELETARERALAVDRPSAAVSATMGKARLLGLDRQQLDVTVDFKIGLADKLKAGAAGGNQAVIQGQGNEPSSAYIAKKAAMFLTPQELEQLTGYQKPSAQARWLTRERLPFVKVETVN